MQWAVRDRANLDGLIAYLSSHPIPFRCNVVNGEDRSHRQNKTIHKWFAEIAQHRGDTTASEVKAECNLRFGGPILNRDDPEWCTEFDSILRPLGYARSLRAIEVFDIPFTRRMTTKQLTEYMESMMREFLSQGVKLTIPKDEG